MSLKKASKETYIESKILKWYRYNSRKLPWRKKLSKKLPNPYYIFVSEFMLQQTTVKAVIPKFNEFIKNWPNIEELSKIKESQILKFWSGLGYYARARNLLKSIKLIAKKYDYKIPKEYSILIKLPGVGDYTAKAIQGIAYNQPVIPVDANIKRIIARIYSITQPLKDKIFQREKLKRNFISIKNSSSFIQALMDYGSAICLPNAPKCSECIIREHCAAFKKKLTNKIPAKKIQYYLKPKKYTRAYLIVNEFNEILIRRRPAKGMLQSMIEIPNDLWVNNKKNLIRDGVIKLFSLKLSKLREKIIYSFSHFDLYIEIYFTKVRKKRFKNYKWLSLSKVDNYGFPTVMKKIIQTHINLV